MRRSIEQGRRGIHPLDHVQCLSPTFTSFLRYIQLISVTAQHTTTPSTHRAMTTPSKFLNLLNATISRDAMQPRHKPSPPPAPQGCSTHGAKTIKQGSFTVSLPHLTRQTSSSHPSNGGDCSLSLIHACGGCSSEANVPRTPGACLWRSALSSLTTRGASAWCESRAPGLRRVAFCSTATDLFHLHVSSRFSGTTIGQPCASASSAVGPTILPSHQGKRSLPRRCQLVARLDLASACVIPPCEYVLTPKLFARGMHGTFHRFVSDLTDCRCCCGRRVE